MDHLQNILDSLTPFTRTIIALSVASITINYFWISKTIAIHGIVIFILSSITIGLIGKQENYPMYFLYLCFFLVAMGQISARFVCDSKSSQNHIEKK